MICTCWNVLFLRQNFIFSVWLRSKYCLAVQEEQKPDYVKFKVRLESFLSKFELNVDCSSKLSINIGIFCFSFALFRQKKKMHSQKSLTACSVLWFQPYFVDFPQIIAWSLAPILPTRTSTLFPSALLSLITPTLEKQSCLVFIYNRLKKDLGPLQGKLTKQNILISIYRRMHVKK